MLHFQLQRLFVWVSVDGFALATSRQVRRYLAMAGTQYAFTAAATAVLPGMLGVSLGDRLPRGDGDRDNRPGFLVMRLVIFHEASELVAAEAEAGAHVEEQLIALPPRHLAGR